MLNVEIACSEAATYKQRTVLCPVRICLRCKQVLTGTLTHAGILSQTGTAARMQWRGQQPCSCCQDAQEAFSHFIYFHLCLSEVALEHESLQIDVFLNVFLVNTPRFQFPSITPRHVEITPVAMCATRRRLLMVQKHSRLSLIRLLIKRWHVCCVICSRSCGCRMRDGKCAALVCFKENPCLAPREPKHIGVCVSLWSTLDVIQG